MTQDEAQRGMLAGGPTKMSWSAIFAGTVTTLALWALLYVFGLALGLSSINPMDAGSAKSSGVFTGIWGVLAPLIALFVGGFVAARSAGSQTRLSGSSHGLVMWGLTTLATIWMLGNVVSSVAGGLFSVGKTAVQATGATVAAGASQAGNLGGLAQRFGLDAEDALRPINERLRSEGKPAVTAQQLEAATRDVVGTAVREQRLDRQLLAQSIAENTSLSRADVDQLATRIEGQFNAFQGKATQAAQSVQTGALKAADATGKVFWGVFGAMFLGLFSALLGGSMGVSQTQQRFAEGTTLPPEGRIPPTRREVYP
ncbi:MAG: hypothetical protein ABW123_12640 [Cystobacter sp.]